MKSLILFLAFAYTCVAQTSPTILKAVSLVNETQLAGSIKSPVTIFTTTQDGFYRMTMYISKGGSKYIEICPAYPTIRPGTNCVGNVFEIESVVLAFAAKAGSAIGFYTNTNPGPYTGTYNANVVLELLDAAPVAQ